MRFIDREEETSRLDRLARSKQGGLAVVWGRRRVGKTRLLVEWSRRYGGRYFVADQSAEEIQRRYFAQAIEPALPGFADVDYRDWQSLLSRLAREAKAAGWRGPVVFDEFPYLAVVSPHLASVLQRWIDHDARDARLIVALAGSSQRMMHGLVLSADAPLYGRATELLELAPLDPAHLETAFEGDAARLIQHYAAWGGVPRYWELAAGVRGTVREAVEHLVLDPLGPLHREPDRLLLEDLPPAVEVRPILDAIGAGAHRVSEIGGRIGRPATSLARPLERLRGMGLVRRDVPFGESEKQSRRSLYVIDDPFFRLWFRVVAAHRGELATGTRRTRLQLLENRWPHLVANAWEDLCRRRLPRLSPATVLGRLGPWKPASRWWVGAAEWDVVSEAVAGTSILLGEVKWSERPFSARQIAAEAERLKRKPAPVLPARFEKHRIVRALFVPQAAGRWRWRTDEPIVATYSDLVRG